MPLGPSIHTARRLWLHLTLAAVLWFNGLSIALASEPVWTAMSPGGDGVADSQAGCSQSIPAAQEAATTDSLGNVYLTGCSKNDMFTVKYGPDGQPLWARRLDLFRNGAARGSGVVVDGQQRVFVGGNASTADFDSPALVAAYDPAGTLLWTYEYLHPSPGNSGALLRAIQLDQAGNLVLLTHSNGQLAVVKINRDGGFLWEWVWENGEEANESPIALATDGAGNVLIAVQTWSGSPLQSDIATIKLSNAGQLQWIQDYAAPWGEDDEALDIRVASNGSVHVLALSEQAAGRVPLVLSYDGAGQFLRTYTGGAAQGVAFDLDSQDQLHVAARLDMHPGTVELIKLGPNGDLLWNAPLPAASYAQGGHLTRVMIDAFDRAIVTALVHSQSGFGIDLAAVRFDQQGNLLDSAMVESTETGVVRFWGAVLSENGQLVAYGDRSYGSRYIFAAESVDLSAGTLWASGVPEESLVFDEWSNQATAIDEQGNVFVAGRADNGRNTDLRLLKWDADGQLLWAENYNGAGDYLDEINAIALGPEGSLYVTGFSSEGNNPGCITMRYSAAGEVLWRQIYAGPGSELCAGTGIAVGPDGSITVSASARTSSEWFFVISTYTSDGSILWELVDEAGGQGASGVLIDDQGRRYVWGQGAAGHVIKIYDSNGLPIGANTANARYFEAVLHPQGGVLAVGDEFGGSVARCFIRRIDATGATLWERIFTAEPNRACSAVSVVAGLDGTIFVASYQAVVFGHTTVVTRLSADGVLEWSAQFNHDRLTPQELILSPAGDPIVVSNVVASPSVEASVEVVELNRITGAEQWRFVPSTDLGPMTATAISSGPDGLPVLAANGVRQGRDPRILVIKLAPVLFADDFE